jgi:hypothetical protein
MPEGSSVLRQMFRFGWDSCNKLYPEHQRFVEAVALDLGVFAASATAAR